MQDTISTGSIISFLKKNYQGAGFIDSLKIKYRSLICPFSSLIELVKPGDKVGDIGCGSGQFLLLVSHFAKPSEVFGIEISDRLINNARKLFSIRPGSKHDFSTYDGVHFPDAVSAMDVIFLVDVLHHVPKNAQEAFMKNLIAKMKKGARFVLKDIDAGSPLVYFNKCHDMIFAREIGNEISFATAKEILQKNGLTIIEENKRRMYVYPHYTLVAEK
jgi:SAM-dependent methyltransferase